MVPPHRAHEAPIQAMAQVSLSGDRPKSLVVPVPSPVALRTGPPQGISTVGPSRQPHDSKCGCHFWQVLPRPPGTTGELSTGLADPGGCSHSAQSLPGHCQHRPHHH